MGVQPKTPRGPTKNPEGSNQKPRGVQPKASKISLCSKNRVREQNVAIKRRRRGVQPKTRKYRCVVRIVFGSKMSPLKGKGEGSSPTKNPQISLCSKNRVRE